MVKDTTAARYERFAREYVIDHNGKQAAIRAGYSEKTAEVQASRLLRNVQVRALVERFESESARRLEITKDRIEQELARIGFADPRRFFDQDGRLLKPSDLGDDEAAALSSVEVFEEFEGQGKERHLVGFTKKVRFWDKRGALEVLGAKFGIGVKKVEQGRPGDFDRLEKDERKKALRQSIKERSVRLGLAKVVPIDRAKKSAKAA